MLHELADTLERGAHVQPQLGFDEWVFGGTAPTVRLQRELWHQGNPHWYDYTAWLVYLSHFVVTLTVAIVLWFVDYPGFRRFRVLIVTVTFAGLRHLHRVSRDPTVAREHPRATCRTPCAS